MAYVPDPTDPTEPIGSVIAQSAAAEFRALKAYILAHVLGGNTSQLQNYIIGGDFDTNPWQRGTSFVSPGDGIYTADRWVVNTSTLGSGTFTVDKDADAPAIGDCGYLVSNCLRVTVTVPQTPLDPAMYAMIETMVEGFYFKWLAQKAAVLSFWHKHDIAGKYCIALSNFGNDEAFVAEYSQVTPGLWELAVIPIPASPSAGTWNYTNDIGLIVSFILGCGVNSQGAAGSWQNASNLFATVNQANLFASTNVFRIAGIQLEPGLTASQLQPRSHIQELEYCQRYYEKSSGTGTCFSADVTSGSSYLAEATYKQTKRVNPITIALVNIANVNFAAGVGTTTTGQEGFKETRVASATGPGGQFLSSWTAAAELHR